MAKLVNLVPGNNSAAFRRRRSSFFLFIQRSESANLPPPPSALCLLPRELDPPFRCLRVFPPKNFCFSAIYPLSSPVQALKKYPRSRFYYRSCFRVPGKLFSAIARPHLANDTREPSLGNRDGSGRSRLPRRPKLSRKGCITVESNPIYAISGKSWPLFRSV